MYYNDDELFILNNFFVSAKEMSFPIYKRVI